VALIEAAEAYLRVHRAGAMGSRLTDIVELGHVVNLLEDWRLDPAGAEIVSHMKSPSVYAHDVLVLAAARTLKRSWKNDVRLLKRNPATTADLSIETAAGRVAVELKAPHELDGNDDERAKSASRVADDVLRRSGKQLKTAPSSLLVVAGYRVPDGPREALTASLVSRLAKRATLAAVAVLSIGRHASEDAEVAAEFLGDRWPRVFTPEQTATMLSLVVAATVGRNPHYRGPVPVVGIDEDGGLRLPGAFAILRYRADGTPELVDGSLTSRP